MNADFDSLSEDVLSGGYRLHLGSFALVRVFGPGLVVKSGGGDDVRLPPGVAVASFFAAIATVLLASWGYRE